MTLNAIDLLRIVFYSCLCVLVAAASFFISKPEAITAKALKVRDAYRDIFEPVAFNQVEGFLLWQAWQRVETAHPRGAVQLLDVKADGESCFVVRYKLLNVDGSSSELRRFVRINWKPFCYD